MMTLRPPLKSGLLRGCAVMALLGSAALGHASAHAQGINATPSVEQGSAQFDTMVPGTTRVIVDTQDTVIDWRPILDNSGAALPFLPQGNTAIFQNGSNNPNFAVLNRIIPDGFNNPALFEGLVQSILLDFAGNQTPGGFVAFYSPAGILVGPTARFEVPQLMLTSQFVDIATISNFVTGANGGQLFLSGAGGNVDIQAGATLVGTPEDSFLIVASPQINMAGDAFFNGSIAYVASNAVFLRHSSGLFDIDITQGVTGGQAIVHTGSSGGPASTGAGDEHVIYGVAHAAFGSGGPVSMLFSGNLGFQPAASATVVNGDIILSGNYDVFGRSVDGDDNRQGANSLFDGRSQTPDLPVNIVLSGVTATSDLLAIGTDQTRLDAFGVSSSFTGDLSLVGRVSAEVDVGGSANVTVGGDLFVSARNFGQFTQATNDENATGGLASIGVGLDSLLTVAGNTMVTASAVSGFNFISGATGSATGGQARILAFSGNVDLQGDVRVEALAATDVPSAPFAGYGAMTGGSADITAFSGGTISIGGNVALDVSATSPAVITSDPATTGAVSGGFGSIGPSDGGGTVDISGNVVANADAVMGPQEFAAGTGQDATGGAVNLVALGPGAVDIAGSYTASARAVTGAVTGGGTAGTAIGGDMLIDAINAGISIIGASTMDVSALGNADAAGGAVAIFSSFGASVDLGQTLIRAQAQALGSTGTAAAGTITVDTVIGGAPASVNFGSTQFLTDATGTGGSTAGLVGVSAANGGITFQNLLVSNLADAANTDPSVFSADNGSLLRFIDFLDVVTIGDLVLAYTTGGSILGGTAPGNLTATFDLEALGTILIDGDSRASRNIAAQQMNLTSLDIEVSPTARFGGNAIALTSTNTTAQALLGGNLSGTGYTLLADEIAGIDGTSLTVNLPDVAGIDIDVVADSLTLQGSSAGGFSSVDLLVDGTIDVIGGISYTSLASGDTLTIGATGDVYISLGTGGIFLDANDLPAGTLVIDANSLIAANANLRGQILADPDSALVAAALLDDGGAPEPLAYISADRVEITAADLVYGQNTGANGVYGGITVGSGGLSITRNPSASGLLRVIAFGRQSDGSTGLTNSDFFRIVEFDADRAGNYDAEATFNNCIIVTGACPDDQPENPVNVPITTHILVEQPIAPKNLIEEGAIIDAEFGFDFPGLLDAPLISEDEVIREPVTSGNDSAVTALVVPAAPDGENGGDE